MSATATASSSGAEAFTRPSPRWRATKWTELVGVILAALVVFTVVRPMLWNGTFIAYDWFPHLWYIEHQAGSLRANGLPSLFVHNSAGVFEPHFAFYGGTLYALAALAALAVDSPEVAFVAAWIFAVVGAYAAWYWLARMAGLGRLAAHAPGVLYVTSPWFLSSIYVLGSWPQTIALSSLLLIIASSLSIIRAGRLAPAPAAVLAISTVLYTGSHNLTLVWATSVTLLMLIVTLAVIPAARGLLSRRGVLNLAVVMVPATLVNAWFLLPDLVYQSGTLIATDVGTAESLVTTSMYLVRPAHVFSIGRSASDPDIPHFALQLPVLAAAWLLAGLVPAMRARESRRSPWLRATLLLLVMMVASAVLLTHRSLILGLPHPYDLIQGPYRLEAYVQIALAGAVICALKVPRSRRADQVWSVALVPVLALSLVQAHSQVNEPLHEGIKSPPFRAPVPYTFNGNMLGGADYVDADLEPIEASAEMPSVAFPVSAEHGDRAEILANVQPGQLILSNLKASRLVTVSGARMFGRDPLGNAVLEVDANATPGAARLTVHAARLWPMQLGRALSIFGVLSLVAVAAARLLLTRRRAA
jgi:hypothetical protein